ncbi:RNA methylase [Cyclospora cayetanensis]|uniref:RNA methylase n=1 Tax=Cyclospora cayetanensis TaxID=88456 RepID=A0A1D3CQV0_9EIME|nr:RNA methylase [Cyclospora cayetanensis]
MADGRAAPQACEQRACLDYGDLEDGECWMPFHRSAPDTVRFSIDRKAEFLGRLGWPLHQNYASGGQSIERTHANPFLSRFDCYICYRLMARRGDPSRLVRPVIVSSCLCFKCSLQEKIQVIARALELTEKDVVYDLGCGDGRFVIECCRLANCNGVGLDLDEKLVAKAQRNAAAAGTIRAEFFQGNFLDPHLDLSRATVIFVYLLPEALRLLAPRLEELLRSSPSLRSIVSLWWPLYATEVSVHDSEQRIFLYRANDLRRQAKIAAKPDTPGSKQAATTALAETVPCCQPKDSSHSDS